MISTYILRCCSFDEINNLLNIGEIKPVKMKYLSLTEDYDFAESWGKTDQPLIIWYKSNLIKNKIKVDYSWEFFNNPKNISVIEHVLDMSLTEIKECIGDINNESLFEFYSANYFDKEYSKEIVTKNIKLVPNLIYKIELLNFENMLETDNILTKEIIDNFVDLKLKCFDIDPKIIFKNHN